MLSLGDNRAVVALCDRALDLYELLVREEGHNGLVDDLAKTYIFNPLAMKETMFRPAKTLWPRIAPTEIDNNLRHHLVQG